jgi:hypothetical protein
MRSSPLFSIFTIRVLVRTSWIILKTTLYRCPETSSYLLLLLLALQSTVNLGLSHDCSPLVLILRSSSPISNAHYLRSSSIESSHLIAGLLTRRVPGFHAFSCSSQMEHRATFGVSAITHTIRHTVGLLLTSDQAIAETSTYTGQHNI